MSKFVERENLWNKKWSRIFGKSVVKCVHCLKSFKLKENLLTPFRADPVHEDGEARKPPTAKANSRESEMPTESEVAWAPLLTSTQLSPGGVLEAAKNSSDEGLASYSDMNKIGTDYVTSGTGSSRSHFEPSLIGIEACRRILSDIERVLDTTKFTISPTSIEPCEKGNSRTIDIIDLTDTRMERKYSEDNVEGVESTCCVTSPIRNCETLLRGDVVRESGEGAVEKHPVSLECFEKEEESLDSENETLRR